MTKYSKVGDFLVSEGLIDAAALDLAVEARARTGVSLGKALADLSPADENAVTSAIARLLQLELLDQTPVAIAPDVRALLPIVFCRKHLVMPLSVSGKSLRLAMADPTDSSTIQDGIFKSSKQVVAVAATETMVLTLLSGSSTDDVAESQQAYDMLSCVNPEGQVEAVDESDDAVDEAELAKRTNLTPVVRLVNLILSGAAKHGASDIHIEPKEKCLQVRHRVDGLLQEVIKIPKHLQDATISRLKIISGMDIEYQLEGINQVQINPKAGVTFAAGLRSILRQDPNIILVGEIRDQETAGIALEAAQTGHLLLSTLHTNDAPSTVSRLLDLGVEPFFVASALNGILAQRLVRRPCPACAVPQEPSDEVVKRLGGRDRLPAGGQWLAARGCPEGKQIGFKGRVAIHEFLQVSDELRDLILRRAPEHEMRRAARAAGMRTLLEDGILKASLGLTTLEAVLEVVSPAETVVVVTPPVEVTAPVAPYADDAVPVAPVVHTDAPKSNGHERVLVVEDSRTIASVVTYYLELEGFEVLLAADGLLGLEMARRDHPHVIVTDVNMPGMDGLAMVKALRADPRTHDIAISMLTSESSVESEALAFAGGADDYMLKPVEPRRLAARVKALAARSRGGHLAVSA